MAQVGADERMRYEQTGTSVEFLAEWISTVPEKGGGTELQSSDPCGTELQSSDWVLSMSV